jgi:hypothetical protein
VTLLPPGADAEPSRPAAPAPLLTAAGLALVQGLVVLGGAVLEVAAIDSDRVAVGLSTAVFFALYGGGLVLCAWGLRQVRPWARGPVILTQLFALGLAWSFREFWPVSVVLAVSAVIVLAGLLHPRSMAAIEVARDAE